eukprot:scaffold6711_cov118-Isochrysis_galbana.AAC.27
MHNDLSSALTFFIAASSASPRSCHSRVPSPVSEDWAGRWAAGVTCRHAPRATCGSPRSSAIVHAQATPGTALLARQKGSGWELARTVEVGVPKYIHGVQNRVRVTFRRGADHMPEERALAHLMEVRC